MASYGRISGQIVVNSVSTYFFAHDDRSTGACSALTFNHHSLWRHWKCFHPLQRYFRSRQVAPWYTVLTVCQLSKTVTRILGQV